MTQFEKLLQMAEENNGIVSTREALNAGISKPVLADFVKKYDFRRVSRGVYCSPDSFSEFDVFYLLQHRCPEIIFSHEAALYLQGMAEREPSPLTVTVKTGYNPSRLSNEGIKVYTIKEELYEMGVTEVTTPYGNRVRVYNPERTVCDIIRSRNNLDVQDYSFGIREFFAKKNRNFNELVRYAKELHIYNKVKQFTEVMTY